MTPLDTSELQPQIHNRLIHEVAASEKRYLETTPMPLSGRYLGEPNCDAPGDF
jgi:hypothetical protein